LASFGVIVDTAINTAPRHIWDEESKGGMAVLGL